MCNTMIVLLSVLFQVSFGVPSTQWIKAFGGSGNETGYCVQQTKDDGYIILGRTTSFGAGKSDVWLVKVDNNGDTLWTKAFGDTTWEAGYFIEELQDSGFIITGIDDSVFLIRTNSAGNTLWTKTYKNTIAGAQGQCVHQTNDGGFILVDENAWLIRTNFSGDTIWTKTYERNGYDISSFVAQQTFDRGFIIMANIQSGDEYNVIIFKTDSLGDTMWTKTYDNVKGYWGEQTSDSGFIITGYTSSFGSGGTDVYLIRTDKNGNKQWSKPFGGYADDKGNSVQQTFDSGFIITGSTESYGVGGLDIWVIKADKDGKKMWDKTFGGTGTSFEVGYFVRQVKDSGFIVVGEDNNWDVELIKMGKETAVEEKYFSKGQFQLYQNYPNPFINKTTIRFTYMGIDLSDNHAELKIYDILGRIIKSFHLVCNSATNYEVDWDGTNNLGVKVKSGIYFYRVETSNGVLSKKMYLAK
ncbi:MAG: T9SS type A sorting domain-containing protein [bacterium]|nr:T9SS type A sorting domain-containing protein [bacterium]